jgi:CheY-like chemotaxis protein
MNEDETMAFSDFLPSRKNEKSYFEKGKTQNGHISDTNPFLKLEIPPELRQARENKKILLIEDDDGIRFLVASALRFEDYEVLEAKDGLEGFELAKKCRPHLIVSDIMMPLMDGFETLTKLKEDPVTAGIPFIFLTSVNNPSSVRLSRELGADNFIVKPFKAKEVLEAIEQHITPKI